MNGSELENLEQEDGVLDISIVRIIHIRCISLTASRMYHNCVRVIAISSVPRTSMIYIWYCIYIQALESDEKRMAR